MTIIREIIPTDLEEVARVGNRYSAETLLGELTDEQMAMLISGCLSGGVGLIAEKDRKVVGLIAGKFIEGFSMGKFLEEVIWYVEPEHRGIGLMLFNRLIELCKKAGCNGIAVSAYNNKYMPIVDRFYIRNGFKEIERKYYKKL